MANQIPFATATDIAGGHLVHPQYADDLQTTIRRESAVLPLSRVDQVATNKVIHSIYAGRPTAAFVDEGAEKPVTGAEFSALTLNIKKIATNVIYTEEMLEDVKSDPRNLINADVEAAFADLIDSHALGYAAGAAITGSFNSELTNTTQTVELGAGADALAVAVSAAIEECESEGVTPSGVILASDMRAHLRDQRGSGDNATTPVYTAGFNREPDSLYGLPITYTSNLDGIPAAAGKIAGLVGDFRGSAIFGMRNDLRVRTSDQATLNVAGVDHNLWQRNELAVQWEMRIGFVAHQIDKAFCKITNAA